MPSPGSSRHRLGHNLGILAAGFVAGGLLNAAARQWLPSGAVKEFLTTGVTPSLGHIDLDLVIFKFGIGPFAMDVSLLSAVGVLIAYLIARSLF
ncbi:MAG: DUF4321 domain-containing protein [Gemmatimonadaceae bacterium]|nr:DUF4321 domain-containing protein [Gemmatimonadaceae bacterium]